MGRAELEDVLPLRSVDVAGDAHLLPWTRRECQFKGCAPVPIHCGLQERLSHQRGLEIFAGLGLHGNTSWSPTALVSVALCWAWSESKNLTDAFDEAKRQCAKLGITALSTYQGFMGALVTRTDSLMLVLWPVLHQRMQEIGGRYWRIDTWVPIAFDGSRSSAPRTESAEKALCAPNYGKGKTATAPTATSTAGAFPCATAW